jgi:aspartate kinase
VLGDPKICKVSIVGIGMRSHVGVASKMFRTLSDEGINIQMITTSEIKTSVVIDEKYMELAVRALHKAFDLDQPAIAPERAPPSAARMRVFAGVVTEWPKVLPC